MTQILKRFSFGHVVTRTAQMEHETLVKFRAAVQDVLPNPEDHFLLRWLRARNFDLKNAEFMLRNYLIWYAENIANPTLPSWIPPAKFSQHLQFKITGKDDEGRLVIWVPIGRWELRKLLEEGHHDSLVLYQYKMLKYLEDAVEQNRKETGSDHLVVLGDSAELSFHKLAHYETIQMIVRFFREYEAYFPEFLHAAYFVNNPRIFSYLFRIVKPLLSSQTIGKAQLFDYNEARWRPELLKHIPKEALPIEYGGTAASVLDTETSFN